MTPADIAELQDRAAAEGWTFTVGENDATQYALEDLCGFIPDSYVGEIPMEEFDSSRSLPAAYDWRNEVGLVPVRHQGGCGSCWAFSTVGALEYNILIHDGYVVDLSEQWLVSCNSDEWGCGGGWYGHDYHQWKPDPCGDFGAVPEEAFPYQAAEVPCDCPYEHSYWIASWGSIQANVTAMKQAILKYGPISVAVATDGPFHAYTGGVFNSCAATEINHAVVLVGWDDNQGPGGVWIMRNSWGPGWGEGGYMRIPYGCNRIGYNPTFIKYYGPQNIGFEYPDGLPQLAIPGEPTTFRVNVVPAPEEPLPGTGRLHYSINGGAFQEVAMTELEPNQYLVELPALPCLGRVNWYVSAEQPPGARRYDPWSAPMVNDSRGLVAAVDRVVMMNEEFEEPDNWTVLSGASSGNWERGVPEPVEYWDEELLQHVEVQPDGDHSPDGTQCYVTGAWAGWDEWTNEVDGGPTDLISPEFNLLGQDARVSYWRYYHGTGAMDYLEVSAYNSVERGWVTVELVQQSEGWTYVEWNVSDYVTPSSHTKVCFRVVDFSPDSVVEALVDDFRVDVLLCELGHAIGDMNCDGVVNNFDIAPFVKALTGTPPNFPEYYDQFPDCNHRLADANGDGEVNNFDIGPFVELLTRQ
ncbi:MAG: C1 family peptidase [Phycisphaerae bacterium]|jgi:hypothetical protein